MKFPAALLILGILLMCDAHEQNEGSEAIANLRLDMERIISSLNRKISDVEHKVMVSICHGADATSIFAKSCRDLDAFESLPTTPVETTTSPKPSVATVVTTMATAGNETVDSAEKGDPSPIPDQVEEEDEYVSPTSEPQGPKGFFNIFGWPSNETLPTPPKPDLDRQCPSDIGPLTACYDRRPILGCYCFILVQRNWWDSAKFCQSNAMQLVSIETVQEQLLLQGLIVNVRIRNANDFVRGLDFGWWTSGSDEAREGHWIWTGTGQPVADLGRGMPDDSSTYNNGLLLYSDGFIWVDAVQNERAYSICEF